MLFCRCSGSLTALLLFLAMLRAGYHLDWQRRFVAESLWAVAPIALALERFSACPGEVAWLLVSLDYCRLGGQASLFLSP